MLQLHLHSYSKCCSLSFTPTPSAALNVSTLLSTLLQMLPLYLCPTLNAAAFPSVRLSLVQLHLHPYIVLLEGSQEEGNALHPDPTRWTTPTLNAATLPSLLLLMLQDYLHSYFQCCSTTFTPTFSAAASPSLQ